MQTRTAATPGQDLAGPQHDAPDHARRAWKTAMEATFVLMARFDEDFREQVGIDVRTYDALLHVFNAGEAGVRMTDLARDVVLTKAGLTALVDRLERRKLMRRTPDAHDRRSYRIVLTPAGERLFRKAAAVHVAGIHNRVGRHLSAEEADLVAEVFARIKAANA